MNKLGKAFWGVLAGCMIWGMVAYAEGSATILETYTGDSDISVYVKNAGDVLENIGVQIATTQANEISVQSVSEMYVPMQTLVLVDNSLSISSNDRDKISQFLQNLISDKLNQEEISIAVFGEEPQILVDYTSDYSTLKKAIDGIVYQDQETYLTDVLYNLLSEKYVQRAEDVYRRILVISDGVDNKSLGYTKDELYFLLKEIQIPIYTIGCTNQKNNEELENMFALSRMTGVDYFLLEEVENTLDITDTLKQDRGIIRLSIIPLNELMDGSKKSVKVTLPDGVVLSTEITMPQQVYEKEIEQEEETKLEPATVLEPELDISSEPAIAEVEGAISNINYLPFLILVSIAVIVTAIIVVVLLLKKNKKKKPNFEPIDDELLKKLQGSIRGTDSETEIINSSSKRSGDNGNTVLIWNQNATYQVVLTDMNSPAKSFQAPLNESIIVGRKREFCDIVLDYDQTVSGKHCEINVRDGRFYVRDLQTPNKTYLNGNEILAETEIFSGNILRFGRLEMRFEIR